MLPQVAAVLSELGGKLSIRARKGASGCSQTDPTPDIALEQPAVADASCAHAHLSGAFGRSHQSHRKQGGQHFGQ